MLTDAKIRNLKSKDKQFKISDSLGLYLLIHPNQSKYWRMKYRFNKKEKIFSIGVYPQTSLSEARTARDEAKKLIKQGVDPTQEKISKKREQQTLSINSFEAVTREWHNKTKSEWSTRHAQDVIKSLEVDIFPFIGKKPIAEITPPEMLNVLRKIESRGALVHVNKVRQRCDNVFKYAIITGFATYNAASDLQGAFKKHEKKNFNSISEKELPEFIQAIDNYHGEVMTKYAIQIVLYTLLRTGEVIGLEWSEVDLDNKLITIPKERMKMKRDHLVPLSRQAMEILKVMQEINGQYKWVFASTRKPKFKHMSANAMIFALYRMGFRSRATIHGIRSTGSTILNEMGFNADVIEKTLNHEPRNAIRAAYNKAQYLDARKDMLQQWADYLSKMDGKIIPIGKTKKQR